MKTLQEIHAELQLIVPEAKEIKVQHSYINNVCLEAWEAQFYDLTGGMLFMAHSTKTTELMFDEVRKLYARLDMESVKKARKAELKRQLEELEEMDIAA